MTDIALSMLGENQNFSGSQNNDQNLNWIRKTLTTKLKVWFCLQHLNNNPMAWTAIQDVVNTNCKSVPLLI